MVEITRRMMMAGVAGGGLVAYSALGGCAGSGSEVGRVKVATPRNQDFYKSDGTFDEAAAKAAYYAMMECHDYPIPDRLRGEEFWTLDFGLGIFAEVGMAGVFWINSKDGNYLGHEIYLLPGQMIPEHWHVETTEAQAKMEGWHVRHGSVTLFSEGTPSPDVDARIPPSHREIAVARTEQVVKPGEVGYLARAEGKHWMLGGPDEAIVTEYATFHDMDGLRFTHPDVKL